MSAEAETVVANELADERKKKVELVQRQAREIARLQRELAESRGVQSATPPAAPPPASPPPRRSSSGPQTLSGFFAQKVDRADLLDRVVALAHAHGYASPFTLDADPTISLEDFLASKIAHNSRIAHQHSEQVRSLDKKLVQEGQRITHLKLRLQELRDLVAEALEI